MEIFAACSATSEADVSNTALLAIEAGTLFTPKMKFSPGRLIVEGKTITAAGASASIRVPSGAERIDASNLLVTPGFIDPHVHGCGGVDVIQGSYESLNAVSRILVRHGTTSFLPTTVSSPPDVLTHAAEQLGEAMTKSFDGAEPLGIHLEGPFISTARRGTHQVSNIMAPDINLFEQWVRASKSTVKLLTIAPELDGVHGLVIMAQHLGVIVAMGHSNATFGEAKAAADLGACYAVHAFNAMRAFAHRDPGI